MIFDTVLERLRATVARGGPDLAINVQQLVAEVQAIVAQLVDPGSLGQLIDQLVVTVRDLITVEDPGPLVQTALALIDAVTGLVNKNDLLALAEALVTTVEDIVGGIDVTGVVGGLITAVEDVVARTVNPSEIVATVESILNYIDQIVAGIDPGPYVEAARQLAAETLIIVSNLERAAAACANGSNPTCAAVLALVDQEAAFVASCASGADPTCASVKNLVLAVVAAGVAAATSCASLNDETCGPLERAALAAAGEAIARVQACAAQNDPTCRTAVNAAKALLQSAGTCTNGLGVGALATGTSPTVDLTSTCAYVGSTAVSTVNGALTTAQQCAAQTYPACAAAVQAVKDAAATAGACVNQFDPAVADVNGTPNGTAVSACGWARDLAQGVVTVATQCVAQTYPACADAITAAKNAAATGQACVEQLSPSTLAPLGSPNGTVVNECAWTRTVVLGLVELAKQCAAQTNPTCAAAVQAVKDAVATAGACVNQFDPAIADVNGTPNSTVVSACALARDVVLGVVELAKQCAAQTNPTCAAAVQAVKDAVATAGACVNQFDPAIADVNGTPNSTVVSACAWARDVVLGVVDLAKRCAAQTYPTCADMVAAVNAALASVAACAEKLTPVPAGFVGPTNPDVMSTCGSAQNLAEAVVDLAKQCAAQTNQACADAVLVARQCATGQGERCPIDVNPWLSRASDLGAFADVEVKGGFVYIRVPDALLAADQQLVLLTAYGGKEVLAGAAGVYRVPLAGSTEYRFLLRSTAPGTAADELLIQFVPGYETTPSAYYQVSANDGLIVAWDVPAGLPVAVARDGELVSASADTSYVDPTYRDQGGDFAIDLDVAPGQDAAETLGFDIPSGLLVPFIGPTGGVSEGTRIWTRMRYSTFIPDKYVDSPTPCGPGEFGGDNRTFGFEGSSRTRAEYKVSWRDSAGRPIAAGSLRSATGVSKRYEMRDGRKVVTQTGHASPRGARFTQYPTPSADRGFIVAKIKSSIGNPLCPDYIPNIDWEVRITFSRNGSYDIVGSHDRAPAHEIYMQQTYQGRGTCTREVYRHDNDGFNYLASPPYSNADLDIHGDGPGYCDIV